MATLTVVDSCYCHAVFEYPASSFLVSCITDQLVAKLDNALSLDQNKLIIILKIKALENLTFLDHDFCPDIFQYQFDSCWFPVLMH